MNIETLETTIKKADLRKSWVQFLMGIEHPGYILRAVSLAYNKVVRAGGLSQKAGKPTGNLRLTNYRHVGPEQVAVDVHALWARIDRRLFGSHFHRSRSRTDYRGFIEHEDTNVHGHLIWAVPSDRVAKFDDAIAEHWERISKSGSVKVEPVEDDRWASYLLKEQGCIAPAYSPFHAAVPSDRPELFLSATPKGPA